MNRLISRNLDSVTEDKLPPIQRQGQQRILFISSVVLGFRRYHEQLVQYCQTDDEVDAVHIELKFPLWNRVLGKSIHAVKRGWDFHAYRHLLMWRYILRHWLKGPLSVAHFDVVHILTEGIGLVVIDFADSPTKFALNIDVTAVQDYRELGFSRLARQPIVNAQRRMFDAAALTVCRNRWCSQSLRDDYGLPPEKIVVARNSLVPPPVSRQDFPPRRAGEPVKLVFVGNDFIRKGGPELLAIHQRHFVDGAELHVCSARAIPDRSARNVVWHGAVPNEVLRNELLPSMDLFVMPTSNDMHPWAILEAASVGLPVISSRLAGIPEMVLEGESGLLCPVGDWEQVRLAIGRLIADAPLRQSMGMKAREHVVRNYNPDHEFQGLIDRLKSLGSH